MKLAQLLFNKSIRLQTDHAVKDIAEASQLLRDALDHIKEADLDLTTMRQAYSSHSAEDMQRAKRVLAHTTYEVNNLAISLLLNAQLMESVWQWVSTWSTDSVGVFHYGNPCIFHAIAKPNAPLQLLPTCEEHNLSSIVHSFYCMTHWRASCPNLNMAV